MRSRRTQVITCSALLAAVVILFALSFRGRSPLAPSIHFVCVQTGKRFEIARERVGILIPKQNPHTRAATLLPCEVRDGKWFVGNRYRGALQELGPLNQFVDSETLEVRG